MVAKSFCITYDDLKGPGARIVVSVEVVEPEHVFVEGDKMRNKDWVGIVIYCEEQRLVE